MSTLTTYAAARVQRAVLAGWRRYEPFRNLRNHGMREYVGAWYGQAADLVAAAGAENDRRAVNLIHQVVQMATYALVGETVKFDVKPQRWGMRGFARIRELMMNHRANEIGLLETHRLVTLDTMFSGMGIFITGVGERADSGRFHGEHHDPMEFFAGRIDLDDYSSDPNSRDWREDRFRAHKLRTTKEALLLAYPGIPPEKIEELPTLRSGGTAEAQGHSHEIVGPESIGDEWITDEVEVWDVSIYDGKTILRGLLPSLNGGEWLVEPEEYMGLEGGPYVLVGMQPVPNNPVPLAPVASIMDLHTALARCSTKIVRQILAAKRATFVHPTEEDAAIQLEESPDDTIIKCQDPGKIRSEEYAGPSKGNLDGFAWLMGAANNETANIQQARGVSGDADTATEASYLQQNMNRMLMGMKADVRKGLAKVGQHLAWYLDTTDSIRQTFSEKVPGGGSIELIYDSKTREGDFTEFTYDVCPYNEPAGDRNMELARFKDLLASLGPAVTAVAQLGGDVPALMRILAQKFGTPELDEVFPTQHGAQVQQALAMKAGQPQPIGVKGEPGASRPGGGRPIDQTRSDMAPTVPGQV